MKVIGAGLPRKATTTQLIALEMLGLPCYHMRDMMGDLAKSVPQWRQALDGKGLWNEVFDGKESVVDWPGSYHWRELMDVYPASLGEVDRARALRRRSGRVRRSTAREPV